MLSENFTQNTMPPAGWSIDSNAANWSTKPSNNAQGGSAPEAKFNSNPAFNGVSRLISPSLDLSGIQKLNLQFNHYVAHYNSGYEIGVATRSQNGEWTVVWSLTPNAEIPAQVVDIEITNSDVGTTDFQFCIYFSGLSVNIYQWFIDDIILFPVYETDLQLQNINIKDILVKGDIMQVSGTLLNLGANNITSFDINWQWDNGEIFTNTIADINVAYTESFEFSSDYLLSLPSELGEYNFKLWLSNPNGVDDYFEDNNLIDKTVELANMAVQRLPLFEEFTSSTCSPCAYFNEHVLMPLLAANEDKYTLVKYQMNWPGSGDDYYTAEGGVRKTYYGVSGVPTLFTNGGEGAEFQFEFDEYYAQQTKMSIVASHQIVDNQITVKTAIVPYDNYDNLTVHIVVIENVTTENVGTNGETEFHNVMMKMMPNAQGTTTSFEAFNTWTTELSADLSQTFVEETGDLSVVVFVQNNSTKEVFQSIYSIENENLLLPPTNLQLSENEADITLNWNPSPEADSYNIYRNNVLINTIQADANYFTDQNLENGIYRYQISAVYNNLESILSNTVAINHLSLAAPQNLQAEVVENNVNLQWTAPETNLVSIGYNIYRNNQKINSEIIISTSYIDNDLEAGTYNYTVSAVYNEGESNVCEPVQVHINITMIPPTNLQVSVNQHEVTLTWQAPQVRNLLGYNVYRDEIMVNSEIITATEFVETLSENGTYIYKISSVYEEGESDFSLPIEVIISTINTAFENVVFNIFPNPSSNYFTILSNQQIFRVELFNFCGQLVYSEDFNSSEIQINIEKLCSGIYFIHTHTSTTSTTTKFIKN